MKEFGVGTGKITVDAAGIITDAAGTRYSIETALAQAYDLERERFYLLAACLRDAARWAKTIVGVNSPVVEINPKIADRFADGTWWTD